MKKIVLAIATVLTVSLSVMAQGEQGNANQRGQHRMDTTEMAKRHTEAIAKRYGLNDEQTVQLLELNKKFASTMRPMMPGRGDRQGRMGRPRGRGNDSTRTRMNAPRHRMEADSTMQRPPRMDEKGREEMRKNMEAYETELKSIMTEEQYKAYKKDMSQRRQRGMGDQRDEKAPKRRDGKE